MINVLGPGDYFDALALLRGDRARTATITALEPSSTLAVTGKAFDHSVRATPLRQLLPLILVELHGFDRVGYGPCFLAKQRSARHARDQLHR